MPRHIRYSLLATLAVVAATLAQFVGFVAGGEPSRPLVWILAGLFVVIGAVMLNLAGRVEEEQERAVAFGATIVPFGCFILTAAFGLALLVLDHADVDSPALDQTPSVDTLD